MATTEWVPPTDLHDAARQRRDLVAKIQTIQAQLGDRQRKATTESEEYYSWRQGAIWAMTNRLQELRLVNDWIEGLLRTDLDEQSLRALGYALMRLEQTGGSHAVETKTEPQ